jgi:hypothetical protein
MTECLIESTISELEWLDRIIAEQAAYYGVSIEKYAAATDNMARLEEEADANNWDRNDE